MLMAAYADAETVDFWNGLVDPDEARVREFTQDQLTPSNRLLATVNRQLQGLHGFGAGFPQPSWACSVDWTADPFGAGWHAWDPGINVDLEIPRMRRPFEGMDLFLCGEVFSHVQGWVEGALCSSELMLQEHFGLPRAPWIPADYGLGPARASACGQSTTT
jgi:hypothetical protein